MNNLMLILLLILVSVSVSKQDIQWNFNETTRIAKPLIREVSQPWTRNLIQNQFYHYKTHFGIIVKEGSEIILSAETASIIENLFVYCFADTIYGTANLVYYAKKTNFTKSFSINVDCVPMLSVTDNVPVTIRIIAKEWLPLPIFDSNDVSLLSSEIAESKFYRNVQVYGFVENHYTQMLLSVQDIERLRSSSLSLYIGLLNQIEVVEYYDYLTSVSTMDKKILSSLKFIDQTSLFVRSERCDRTNYSNPASCSKTNFTVHDIVTDNIEAFLQPKRGSSWILLQQFAHYYNRKETDVCFGETYQLWNDLFAIMYQQRFRKQNNRNNSELPYKFQISSYRSGKLLTQWSYEEKLSLFISLFGYDGTDTNIREFRIRHMPDNQILTSAPPNNMLSTILEIFFDLYDVNLIPFFKKVINWNEQRVIGHNMELLLSTGKNAMPVVDFNMSATDLKERSQERDLREISPLMLMTEMNNHFNVTFTIESSINLTSCCLYLNNICHNIVENSLIVKLLSGVYSVYVAEKKEEMLYISNITYYSITADTFIIIKVRNIEEKDFLSPFVDFSLDALDVNKNVFLNMFVSYKNMTLQIKEFYNEPSLNSSQNFFTIDVKRNGSLITRYTFTDYIHYKQFYPLLQDIRINDEINVYHKNPDGLKINSNLNNEKMEKNYNFLVTNIGLRPIYPESGLKYEFDVQTTENDYSRQLLKIFINYKNMSLEIYQFFSTIKPEFKLYFSIRLERNASVVFDYKFSAAQKTKKLLNATHNFEIDDKIYIYHAEPNRLMFNFQRYNIQKENNKTFIARNDGLHTIENKEIYNLRENRITQSCVFQLTFNAFGSYDSLFLKIFINFINSTITIRQLEKYIPSVNTNELYFSVSLKRDDFPIFKYDYLGEKKDVHEDKVYKFLAGDEIYFYHLEPKRMKFNLPEYGNVKRNNSFILKEHGLYNMTNETSIIFKERNIAEKPVLHYTFEALGSGDGLFLQIFINYNKSTINVKQLRTKINVYFVNKLYFSVRVERNCSTLLEYNFIGDEKIETFVNANIKFKFGDKIHFYHSEPNRFKIYLKEYYNSLLKNHTFVLGESGLRIFNDRMSFMSDDSLRIRNFHENKKIDSNYNAFYQLYFAPYLRSLHSNDTETYVSNYC